MAITAPRAAPELVPMMPGLARGFLNIPCMIVPAHPRENPTNTPVKALGSLPYQTMFSIEGAEAYSIEKILPIIILRVVDRSTCQGPRLTDRVRPTIKNIKQSVTGRKTFVYGHKDKDLFGIQYSCQIIEAGHYVL